jgi:hypothetical protein
MHEAIELYVLREEKREKNGRDALKPGTPIRRTDYTSPVPMMRPMRGCLGWRMAKMSRHPCLHSTLQLGFVPFFLAGRRGDAP